MVYLGRSSDCSKKQCNEARDPASKSPPSLGHWRLWNTVALEERRIPFSEREASPTIVSEASTYGPRIRPSARLGQPLCGAKLLLHRWRGDEAAPRRWVHRQSKIASAGLRRRFVGMVTLRRRSQFEAGFLPGIAIVTGSSAKFAAFSSARQRERRYSSDAGTLDNFFDTASKLHHRLSPLPRTHESTSQKQRRHLAFSHPN